MMLLLLWRQWHLQDAHCFRSQAAHAAADCSICVLPPARIATATPLCKALPANMQQPRRHLVSTGTEASILQQAVTV
jgi:hypothetical protein